MSGGAYFAMSAVNPAKILSSNAPCSWDALFEVGMTNRASPIGRRIKCMVK